MRAAEASAADQGQERRPTAVITQPTAPMTARNSSPPTQDAAATPPNRTARTRAIAGQPDPLDHRPRLARLARDSLASRGSPGPRIVGSLIPHPSGTASSGRRRSVPRPRRRDRPARRGPRWRPSGSAAGANPMNHECGSPVPPSSAVPDLPAVVMPGTLAPDVNCWPRSPSTAATIAVVIACASVAERTRPIDFGPIVRVPLCLARSSRSRAAAASAPRRSRRSRRRAPSGAASRTSRPGRTTHSRARRRR